MDKQFNSGLRTAGVKEVLSLLYPENWLVAIEADEMAIILKDRMIDLNLNSPMDCREILSYRIQGSLGSSRRKNIERLEEMQQVNSYATKSNSLRMAIKSQGSDVQTKIACMKQIYDAEFCSAMGNYFLMREIFLFRYLQHPNLIGLHGYCLRGDQISTEIQKKGVVMVVEAGEPLTLLMVSSMSWSRRVQLALDVASLLEYLQSSPLGSIGLPQVQLKDFVLVDRKVLKLVDIDEAELGEKACSHPQDCFMQGTDVGVLCNAGLCDGLNAKLNLKVVGSALLDPLLRQPPVEEEKKVQAFIQKVKRLDISPSEMVSIVEPLAQTYTPLVDELDDSDGYQHLQANANKRWNNVAGQGRGDRAQEEGGLDNRGVLRASSRDQPPAVQNPQPDLYSRLESSNYPGQFDFPCPDSRVLWGCVMTMNSMEDAMNHCTSDPACKAFVIFSSRPEQESKLTVVFKSHSSSTPHVNLGTTVFIKKRAAAGAVVSTLPSVNRSRQDNDIPGAEDKKTKGAEGEADPWARVKEIQDCLRRSHDNQEDALRSREKRLMAHMGLKGQQEKDWRRQVRFQKITGYSRLLPVSGQQAHGGSMLVSYNATSKIQAVTVAKFMRHEGPDKSHVLFALVYFLDRLLGLYHTPPVVEGFLEGDVVNTFKLRASWESTFGQLVHPDGSLRGLLVAPSPKVLKRDKLVLQPLTTRVVEVVPFNRTEKMQLEYVLLWWLGHIAVPGHIHRGFKGHLIHVEADMAFQEPAVNYEGYFNHCQFPNVVYKLLNCFRCSQVEGGKICHLGQEAVRRVEAAGLHLSNVHLPELKETDYPALINGAASKAVEIVDLCIQEFGREIVLY